MSNTNTQNKVVMGIYPRTRGFGYVVFRGPWVAHRWGVKDIRGNKNSDNMLKIQELVSQYRPDVVVLDEQMLIPGIKRISQRERLEALLDAPLAPRCRQKPLNIGLFDEDARNQLSLF